MNPLGTRRFASVACAIAFAFTAGCSHRRPVTANAPDRVPAHDTFTVASRSLGEARLINVYTPRSYQGSTTSLPVLYMPDGGIDEDFPHVVNTVDSLIALAAIRPVIVVGIPNTQRRRDLTGPTRIARDSAIAPHVGGSAAFRRFIRDELMPAVDAHYRTTGERSIVGESLAGLFILETFLTEPAMFKHYIALDPSLWWNNSALLDAAPARLAAFDGTARTLFLANSDEPEIAAGTARFAELLRASAPRTLTWVYVARPDLTHGTIFRGIGPTALTNALR
jgi:predicted alpha/beta superfamily hydrolase